MNKKLPLTAKIKGDAIVISVNAATVKFATENHPTFWNPDTDENTIRVVNARQWLQSVCRYITCEREDGSSLLTDLFDKAIENAVEQGEEGLIYED